MAWGARRYQRGRATTAAASSAASTAGTAIGCGPRYGLVAGGQAQILSYLHRTRRNLIVTEVTLNCSRCTNDTVLTLAAFSGEAPQDVRFDTVTSLARWARARGS